MYLFVTHQFLYVDLTVSFQNTVYNIGKNAGSARPILVLSNPLATDVTIQVTRTDALTIGECFNYI